MAVVVVDNDDDIPYFEHAFQPSDQDCIDILIAKLQNPLHYKYQVTNFNIYSVNPEQIMLRSDDLGYFYTPRMKRTETTTTNKPNREAGAGRWHPYTGQTEIRNQNTNVIMGYKQSFRYCEQTLDGTNGKEIKSKWLMHEYSLHYAYSDNFDRFTLNKIYRNNRKWKMIKKELALDYETSQKNKE